MTEQGEYLAECFLPGVSEGAVAALDARVKAVASEVRYLGSVLVPGDEVVLCFFEGPRPRPSALSPSRRRCPSPASSPPCGRAPAGGRPETGGRAGLY